MNKPIIRIFSAILILILVTGCVALFTGASFWVILLLPLGAVIGPFALLSLPFTTGNNYLFIGLLIISFVCILIGFRKKEHVLGQFLAVLGIAGWIFCGFIGLGAMY